MIPYNTTIAEEQSADLYNLPLQHRRLGSVPADERMFSEHDNLRPGFPLDEAPGLSELPTLPMFASFSSSDDGESDDEDASLVSSLSRDDSMLRFAEWQPPSTSLMVNRDIFDSAAAEAHYPRSMLPPMEIIIPVKEKKTKTTPLSVKPDWLQDDFETLHSPVTSMSYSSSDNWDAKRKMTRSPLSSILGLSHQSFVPATTVDPSIMAANNHDVQNIFRPAMPVHKLLVNDRPEPARRAVTFPEISTTTLRSSAFHPYQPAGDVLPKWVHHNDQQQPQPSFQSVPPLPQPLAFHRSQSFPNNHISTSTNENVLITIQSPAPSKPSYVMNKPSSPEDVKLLGQRQNRAVGDVMLHRHGTVAGVGSEAGQISFYTAPTTSSSTGDEGFQHHVKVQGMLNTLVMGNGASVAISNGQPQQRRRRKGRKPFWNPIRHLIGKQSS